MQKVQSAEDLQIRKANRKTCHNKQALRKCRGDILIITDANVIPEVSAIRKLARNFSDDRVGLADTHLMSFSSENAGHALPENKYLDFEARLKYNEGSTWGTMMGPFGGFYAVRKSFFLPNSENTLADDFRIGMNVLVKGKYAISDPEAVVSEDIPDNICDEFRRKVRISAGNFQNLFHFSKLLLHPFSRLTFSFVSHKALRWLTPVLWLFMIMSNLLLFDSSIFYRLFLLLQVIFLILPPLDFILKRAGINCVPLRFITHLYMMNIALFMGLVKYLSGIKSGVWTPTNRFQK